MASLFLLVLSIEVNAQFHAAFGIGTGSSKHADSYVVDKGYKLFQYSGFRALILEARVHYTLPSETSIYASLRLSPNVETISPYKYSYVNFGLEQMLPGTPFYFTGAYGKNKTSSYVSLSSGNLWLLGAGIQFDFTRLQFSYMSGKQQNQDAFLRENERRISLTLLFSTL